MERLTKLFKLLNSFALLVLLITFASIGVHVYRVTVPKIDQEIVEAQRLTLEVGLTASEARKASAEERGYLAGLNGKVSATLDSTNELLRTTNQTIVDIDKTQSTIGIESVRTLRGATDAISGIPSLLAESQKAVVGLEPVEQQSADLVSELRKVTPGIVATSGNVASTTQSIAGIAADAKVEADKFVKPKPRTFWSVVLIIVGAIKPNIF